MTTMNPNLVSNLKNILLYAGIGILGLLGLFSCSKDDAPDLGAKEGKIAISAKGTYTNPVTGKSSLTAKDGTTTVELTSFLINVTEFELEFDLDDDDYDDDKYDDGFFDYDDDLELKGPFELDLLKGEIAFINATVPVGTYEELEFKINKGKDANSDLFEKSILIKGNIDNVPFIFWHDFDEEVEVDFDDPNTNIIVKNNTTELTIEFDLSLLINGVDGIDLSQAVDGNNDGVIEINPNDLDGNNAIAQQLKAKIKNIIDLLDD